MDHPLTVVPFPKIQWPLPEDHKPLWEQDDAPTPDKEFWTQAHLRLFGKLAPSLGLDLASEGPHKHIRAYMDLGDSFIYFLDHCILARYPEGWTIYPPIPHE